MGKLWVASPSRDLFGKAGLGLELQWPRQHGLRSWLPAFHENGLGSAKLLLFEVGR